MKADADIKCDAEAQLRRALPLSHALIQITIRNGAATLKGDVEWSYQRAHAHKAVARSCAVVSSRITVSPNIALHEIRLAVTSALRHCDGVTSSHLEAQTAISTGICKDNLRSWAQR